MADSARPAASVETPTFDVAVVGDGIIGLAIALDVARAGASCALIGSSKPGAGSGAAAGILAPSTGQRDPKVRAFFRRSLDLYSAFLSQLKEFDPDLSVSTGLLEILSKPTPAEPLGAGSERLTQAAVGRLSPALHAPFGAILHSHDGAIDSTRLLTALRSATRQHGAITQFSGNGAGRLDVSATPARVTMHDGTSLRAKRIVLAAGAWSPLLEGLPRRIPIRPVKGQMLALDAPDVLRQPVTADHIYLVPRAGELVVGATREEAGYDITTTDDAIESLLAAAREICPTLADSRVTRRWAGLRPTTPDQLPILGADPDFPALIYACGHSRNGILLAPITAQAIRGLVEHPGAGDASLAPFSVTRF